MKSLYKQEGNSLIDLRGLAFLKSDYITSTTYKYLIYGLFPNIIIRYKSLIYGHFPKTIISYQGTPVQPIIT